GDYTIVVETMDSAYTLAGSRRELVFHLGEGFPAKPVHVWRSNVREQFVKVATLQPEGGVLRYAVDGESIFTFSTLTGQTKGGSELTIPESRVFPLPYTDTFDQRPEHALPKYFIDQSGVFESVDRPNGPGACLRQVVPSKGIEWHPHANPPPYTVMGDERWKDYEVEVESLFDGPGTVNVYGRITNVSTKDEPPAGYWLEIDQQGHWKLNRFKDTL
ncbi:MAG: hypothetical protein NTY38_26795, partial [Acidobacteria bacterium]|nr:hypothetical protein [Acidobacteriota bacterium]